MSLSRRLTAAVAAGAAFASLALTGNAAAAAFPDLSDCDRAVSSACLDFNSVDTGALKINRTSIPLANGAFRIRGGVNLFTSSGAVEFVAPTASAPFTGSPNPIPGGLLGIALPLPGNTVNASFELAGDFRSINFDPYAVAVQLPVKIRLANRYLNANCHIGSDASPIVLSLVPDPLGTDTYDPVRDVVIYSGTIEFDDDFAVPGATGCGYYPRGTLVNTLINQRLGLPSAAGQNSLRLPVEVAFGS